MNWDKLYDKMYAWLFTYGPKILIGILIIFVGQWLLKLFRKWLRNLMKTKQLDSSLQSFLVSVIVAVLNILLILGVMQAVGIQLTIFAAIIGAVGVAAGLALSGILQNFTSGILILLLKPFKVGDNIATQGQDGTVTSIQIFYTVVLTFDNKTVIIPNSKLSNEIILNLSREGKRRLDIELKFGYGLDFEQIKKIIADTLQASANILKDPAPRISIAELGSDGFTVIMNAWLNAHGFTDAKYELQVTLLKNLKGSGIKLPGL